MMRARVCLAGTRVWFLWIAALAALLVGTPGVQANIQPPTMLLVHVQPWDPDYCALPGVYECDDIVQTTTATGDLLVVVYMACGGGYPPNSITSLDFTLQAGGSWGWYPYEVANCTDAQFSYEENYYTITLHFDWPEHPYPPGFMPLCAFWTNAWGHACLEVVDDASIRWGYPGGWDEAPLPGKAEAGVECEYACLLDCDRWGYPCVPTLTPEELHFELSQGTVGQALMQSAVTGGWAQECVFDATEPWVTLEVTETSHYSDDIRVTVNTAGLAVGEYEARVRATCDARDCSRIYLTVTEEDPQSIPDDDPTTPGAATRTTWGGVKDLYRGR